MKAYFRCLTLILWTTQATISFYSMGIPVFSTRDFCQVGKFWYKFTPSWHSILTSFDNVNGTSIHANRLFDCTFDVKFMHILPIVSYVMAVMNGHIGSLKHPPALVTEDSSIAHLSLIISCDTILYWNNAFHSSSLTANMPCNNDARMKRFGYAHSTGIFY